MATSITHPHALRVRGIIGDQILGFCRENVGKEFHLVDLYQYVLKTQPIAPNSAARILQYLKRDGLVDYMVVNRKRSLYTVISVANAQPETAVQQ